MSKRKKSDAEEPSKRQKTTPQKKSPVKKDITKFSHVSDYKSWKNSDILKLLSKIEENIPQDDSLSYLSRLEKLNWEHINFENHSTKECKEVWGSLYKQVRKFRFLSEIVTDVKNLVTSESAIKLVKPAVKKQHSLNPSSLNPSPLKPKHPPNIFMIYVSEKRQEVADANPGLLQTQVARKLGQMFKMLTPQERAKYDELAKAAREEYTKKLNIFYNDYPELKPKENKKKRISTEDGPLKKPKTPFELYVEMESGKDDASTSRFIMIQKCKEMWSELSDKEKFFWINWAEELYSKYLEDLKEYVKKHPDYEPEKFKPVLTKKEKQIKDRCCGKPDKPPYAAYHLFVRMNLETEKAKQVSSKDFMYYVSEKWKACTHEEKNEYKTRIAQMWEEYHKKLEEFLMTLPPEDRDKIRKEEGRKKKMEPSTPKTETKKNDAVVKPKQPEIPPSSVHKYFLKEYSGDDAASAWKALSPEGKKVFEDQWKELRIAYIRQYEAYLKTLSRDELEKLGATLGSQDDSGSESESLTSSTGEEDEEEDF